MEESLSAPLCHGTLQRQIMYGKEIQIIKCVLHYESIFLQRLDRTGACGEEIKNQLK